MTDAPAPSAGRARVWPATLIVWALLAGFLLIQDAAPALKGFGDTDDATRMVMVRELLHGRGWWDQTLWRFQPPVGVVMHWSRLLDGALAALDGTMSALFGAVRGEMAMRLMWPLLLIGPAVASILAVTRQLTAEDKDTRPAVLAAAAACVVGLPLFSQFHPGRIDHHNVQILLWLAAWAGASARRPWLGGVLAGAAMGLGLAIGLEALIFYAVIAGFMALRFAWDAGERTRLRAFAGALLAVTVASFLIQTPPTRWGLSACDALAANLVSGIGVGAIALLAASLTKGGRNLRFAAVAGAGVAAAVAYAGLDPRCLHGPFAEINPAIRPIWLSHVQEMTPVWVLMRTDHPGAFLMLVAVGVGVAGWAAIGWARWRATGRAPGAGYWLAGLMLAAAVPQALAMLRAASYLYWAETPPLAVAAVQAARWLGRDARLDRVRLALVAMLLSPTVEASLGLSVLHFAPPALAATTKSTLDKPDHCFEQASYAQLAALPAGRVLAEPDLGPFVLAYTPHSAVSAPYHRMAYGLLASHAAFAAPVTQARGQVSALGVDYVVSCPAHADKTTGTKGSLQAALTAHHAPAWLQALSPAKSNVEIYRVVR